MKRFTLLLAAFVLLGTSTAFSAIDSADTNKNTTSVEMAKLLKNPDFIVDHEMEANVLFTVNDDNEIVVLSVETEDSQVASYVKDRLNNRELKSDLQTGKQYVLPVRIKSEK
jgi:hypothetical protein